MFAQNLITFEQQIHFTKVIFKRNQINALSQKPCRKPKSSPIIHSQPHMAY